MSTYRAAVCVQMGKPLEIQAMQVVTELKDNQIQLINYASTVNLADIERCRGQRDDIPALPYIPGAVAAGKVAAVGKDVKNVKVGDRVVALNYGSLGGMAEQLVVACERVFPLPDCLSYAKAAGATVAYSAAISALEHKAQVQKGDVVLVSGAAGATGLAIADAVKNMFGCEVITLCSGQLKYSFLAERGFKHIVDSNETEDIVGAVRDITGGRGVKYAFDVVGGNMLLTCLQCLSIDGTLVIVGFSSGEIPAIPADILKQRSLTVVGLNWKILDQAPKLLQAAGNGHIDPFVCKEFHLENINEAYQLVWERKSLGKVVVRMRLGD